MLRKILSFQFTFFFGLIVISGFGSIAKANGLDKPPVDIPFYPQKVGETYSFDVNVIEQLTYSIGVRFYLVLPNKWSHFLDKDESPEDARHLSEILGGARTTESGEWVEPGVPAKFRVQIVEKSSKAIFLDELISQPKTRATYMGRYAELVTKALPTGIYAIHIEYLYGARDLAPLHAKILFARAHHGK